MKGAAELLRTCAERGWQVVLASSATGQELDAMRRALDATDAITTVTSADDVRSSKPSPDFVQQALEQSGVDPADAVFIGDTVWGMRAGGRAHVPCIGVLSGGFCRSELLDAGAREVYADPGELQTHIHTSPLR